jgi:hypothetical protein
MEKKMFKGELHCLKDIENKEATLVLSEDDLRIEYAFPLKEAMCFQSVNYASLYDRLHDYGCVERDDIVSELESDVTHEYAYQSEVWEREYDFEDELEDPNDELERENMQSRYEDNDDQKPFFYGIGGGWFEFPDDVFEIQNMIFSLKRDLYFIEGKECTFDKIKEFFSDLNKCRFARLKNAIKYDLQTKDDWQKFFETIND